MTAMVGAMQRNGSAIGIASASSMPTVDLLLRFGVTAEVGLSVGPGFVNDSRAGRAAEALHSQIRRRTAALRDGRTATVDVTGLVPGDVVELRLGDAVAPHLRLLDVNGLECDGSVLSGEAMPVADGTRPVRPTAPLAELSGCASMGTVVHADSVFRLVVATAARAEFGKNAAGPSTRPSRRAARFVTAGRPPAAPSVVDRDARP